MGGLEAGLAQFIDRLSPEDIRKMTEAMKGVDLSGILGAFGGGRGSSQAGAEGGPLTPPAGTGFLTSFLPAPRLDLSGSLTGISEIVNYFTANPLHGRKWSLKDAGGLLKLFGSPNVQSLVGTARVAPGLVKAGRQLAPVVAALRKEQKAKGRRRGSGEVDRAKPTQAQTTVRSEPLNAAPPAPPVVRFHLSTEPPPVLEPWRG